MKKHAFFNYHDNKETYIDDASKNNHKLNWKLLKDAMCFFNNRTVNDIPPLSLTESNGKDSTAFTDIDKVEILNKYFCSISNISNPGKSLQEMFYTVVNLLLTL